MNVDDLAKQARAIWGNKTMTLEEIVVVIGVVYGDICRQTRAGQEGEIVDETELQKELGNLIFSIIRWCGELGFDAKICIEAAIQAQTSYAMELRA